MHTDTFSFEVDGRIYEVHLYDLVYLPKPCYVDIYYPGGDKVTKKVVYEPESKTYKFDFITHNAPDIIYIIQQKISDKIISRNE